MRKDEQRTRLPARAVWTRFGITDRTLDRWVSNKDLQFPQPMIVNKRRYFFLDEIEAWERAQAAKSVATPRGERGNDVSASDFDLARQGGYKPNKRQELPDPTCPGLYLVVQPNGQSSWCIRYRFQGKSVKHTVGPAASVDKAGGEIKDGRISLETARHKFRQVKDALATLGA